MLSRRKCSVGFRGGRKLRVPLSEGMCVSISVRVPVSCRCSLVVGGYLKVLRTDPLRPLSKVTNTAGDWERGVGREVTAHHIGYFSSCGDLVVQSARLLNGRAPGRLLQQRLETELEAPGMAFRTARVVQATAWTEVAVGDLVIAETAGATVMGEAEMHLAVEGQPGTWTSLHLWAIDNDGPWCWKAHRTGQRQMIPSGDILASLVWAGSGSVLTVLKPSRC